MDAPIVFKSRPCHSAVTGSFTPSLDLIGGCSQALQFLRRVTGLNYAHQNNYVNLICGLVNDGVWAKLDALWIFATQNSTVALTNLVSSSFTATLVNGGTPLTFTTDRGFNNGGTTANASYIETNFNGSTNGTTFTQNSNHASGWVNDSNVTSQASHLYGNESAGPPTASVNLLPKFDAAGGLIVRVNGTTATTSIANANRQGHYLGSRTASGTDAGYKNAVDQAIGNVTSGAHLNATFRVLNAPNGATFNNVDQVSMFSLGGGLSQTDTTNFYNRLRTYMTAVGVP